MAFNVRFAVHLYLKSLPLLNKVTIGQCIPLLSNYRFARHLVPAARLIKKLVLFDAQTVLLRSGCQRSRGITAEVLFEAIKG